MSEVDSWSVFSDRYEADTLEEFEQFVEQIELVMQLLEDGSRSRVRTAITELHSLADILLYRRAQAVFHAADGGTPHHHALTFTHPERRDLERSFPARVTLATRRVEGLFPYRLDPLLDDSEAEIFRIAHAYRNPAYHRGQQNPATLPLIARIFLTAVTRAWTRSQPPIGIERRRWGSLSGNRIASVETDGSFVRLDHAASTIADSLVKEARIDHADATEVLADDLELRVRAVASMVADLDRDGLDPQRVAESLAWAEMFEELARERETIELEEERRSAARELVAAQESGEPLPEEISRAYVTHQHAYARRVFGSWRTFKMKPSLEMVERMPKRIAAMRRVRTPSAVLRRYRELDRQMEAVERRLWEIARGWDQHIQMEVDRSRGK